MQIAISATIVTGIPTRVPLAKEPSHRYRAGSAPQNIRRGTSRTFAQRKNLNPRIQETA